MQSQCKRPICLGLFLTIVVSVCAAQQPARSEVNAFAQQLVNSSSQQRTELLAANPQLITVALRRELLRRGNNLFIDTKYAPALDVYRLAEKVAEQIKDKEGVAEISLNIGSVYYFQAQYHLALENYRKAQQLFASLGNRFEAARSLLGLALTFQAQQKLPEALANLEQALKEFEALDDREEMANALASIGSIHYEQGNFEAASKTLLRLSSLRSDGGNLLRLAAAFYMQKDYAQALTYYEQALELANKLANTAEAISALTGAANCYYNQRDYDRALEFYTRSLEVSSEIDDQSGIATQLQNIGNVHRARGDYGSALQSYLKSLEAAAVAQTKASVATTLGSIGVVRSLQGDNAQAIEYFDKSLQAFEASGDQVGMARLFSYIGNSRYIQGQYDLALAAYQRGVELHRSSADTLNQAHLRLAIGTVYATQKKYAEALENYQQALTIGAKSRLIIIPDGVLWDVPFAAVQPSPEQYLVDQKTLSYTISVSALAEMGKNRSVRPMRPAVLAFADPVLTNELVERLKTTYRDLSLQQTSDPSTQIEHLRSIYGRTRSQFYTGVTAKKEKARNEASSHPLLHFATRAFLDQSVPLYSFIVLSPDAPDDGLLRLWEVTSLNSKARVVVLPNSNLAQARARYSNALVAMSWAWFVAGTPTVVMSRWQVDEPSATAFSSELHRNLLRSNDYSESLRQSVLKLRHSKPASTYEWSGFLVLGKP